MKPFGALLSFAEAKKIVDANTQPVTRTETVPLDDASGRVLADNITATLSIPPFNRSAMDGYAVIASDTFGASQRNPRILTIIGEIHAGETADSDIDNQQCLQIATGAMMPEGADAVVMVEDTEAVDNQLKVFKAVYPKANVAAIGEDIEQGTTILHCASFLDAGRIGVLASQGISDVPVYARPEVAILPSGEEVVTLDVKLKPGQVYDINSHTIASVVRDNGGIPVIFDIAPDDAGKLKEMITEALESDLVVISGGSSVGERDLLTAVLEDMGEVLFHGIQVKPGKPTIFVRIQDKPLMGMPGYPTSCLINTYLFILPLLRKMAQLPPRRGQTIEARLGRRVPGSVGRRQFLTVRIEGDEVIPVFKESGAITSVADADGYIEIAENIDLLEKGQPVTVTLF